VKTARNKKVHSILFYLYESLEQTKLSSRGRKKLMERTDYKGTFRDDENLFYFDCGSGYMAYTFVLSFSMVNLH
jgi:hypothetical protein